VPALAAALAIAWAPGAPGPPARADYVQYATTESYLAAGEAVRDGYVAGLIDTLYAFEAAPEGLGRCVEVMRLREVRAAFDRWLRNHPGEWRYSLPSNFVAAVESMCR
jgi:hypothetical protein